MRGIQWGMPPARASRSKHLFLSRIKNTPRPEKPPGAGRHAPILLRQLRERRTGRRLLGLLLAVAGAAADDLAVELHTALKDLRVIRAGRADHLIAEFLVAAPLHQLLQLGLEVAPPLLHGLLPLAIEQDIVDHAPRLLHAAVEIDRRKEQV